MRKLTLEQRIAFLEKHLCNKTIKNESFESDLNEAGARAAANQIAKQFGRMVGVGVTPEDLGHDVILSPMYGWLTINDTYEIEDDPNARFGFQYELDEPGFTIIVHPSDNSVNLINEDGYSIDPKGHPFSSDSADIVAFPLPKWKGFDFSMIDEDDDGYNVEADDDFNDYYDESCKHESKQTIAKRVARLEKFLSRKSR